MKKQKQANKSIKKQPPLGVKIISIYIILGLIFTLITGYESFKLLGVYTLILILPILIVVSISITLWRGYHGARIMLLIISSLGILNNLIKLNRGYMPIINIVLLIPIIWYLGFNKEAKEYFKK